MMVYLESFRYSPRSSFRTVVSGQRVPIELTSLGRAYLRALPQQEQIRELHVIAERRSRAWPQLEADIRASFTELETDGFCIVRWQPGVAAVAASILLPGLAPHALNMSIASSEPLPALRRTLGPWLLDLRRRCLADLEASLLPEN
ncbi:hypothetical protein [Bosea sp. Tri-44]|uniref:hypothetical protein n=1 Tax=Bosea sp. Tri-44 TaxID=1972137 RepID=UPI00100E8F9C|nr:hypothetical protein [Bosea sp. Tri-44]